MKKRCRTILVISMMLFTLFSTTCFASSNDTITVFLNTSDSRVQIDFDTKPVIDSGRVLVPAKPIFEAFGMYIEWDAVTKTVYAITVLENYSYCTEIQIGNNIGKQYEYYVDLYHRDPEDPFSGIIKTNPTGLWMDVPAKIIGGRTMVPLRFIAELLGCEVEWNPKTKVVDLTTTYSLQDIEYNKHKVDTIPEPEPEYDQEYYNDNFIELFDDAVDTYPGAFQ